jgi:putative hydrolase of the HAD superfamily
MTALAAGQDALRAIVFDLDGTLYCDDTLGEQVHRSACRYIAELTGTSGQQAESALQEARSCQSGSGGTLSRAVVSLGGNLKELHRRFNLDVHPEEVLQPDPRVRQLLESLAARFELHVYTNNNQALSGRIMAQLGLEGCFQRVFTIEDSWRPKPDLVVLQGILDTIGKKPGETLFVGDRYEVDLQLPATLGCAVLETRTVEELLTLAQLIG